MAHRGRLNVLAHIMNKPYDQILAEFKDPLRSQELRDAIGWTTGDVKYHRGSGASSTRSRQTARRSSHWSSPCRPTPATWKWSTRWWSAWPAPPARAPDQRGPAVFDPTLTLPILIHGDAAFPGQGVVAETLNLFAAARLLDRRHDPHHRQQPDRLYHRTRRSAQHALRQRPGQGLQDPDHPRQRRRPGGLHRGGAHRLCLPQAFRQGLPDRPDRLPALGPQRGRRTGFHPAARCTETMQQAPHGAPAVGGCAGRSAG